MLKWTKEQFILAVQTSNTISDVARKLHVSPRGSHRVIKKYIKKYDLNIEHFFTRKEIMSSIRHNRHVKSNEDLFVENGTYSETKRIKKIILKDKIFPYKCKICDITNWQEKNLVLHLDHINGNHCDNRLENLRFLCPNCHSQTDTYCGKATKGRNKKQINYCKLCFNIRKAGKELCQDCNWKNKATKIVWPSDIDLKQSISESSCSAVARQLGVSDTAINKRLKRSKIH